MIQPTIYNGSQTRVTKNVQEIKEIKQSTIQEVLSHKEQNKILNIYNEHLLGTSPTYSDDVKELMKSKNIEENSLNATVVNTMHKQGVDITKESLNIIVNQLQEEHLFQLFEQGYDIESLAVDIIAKEIILNEDILISKDKDEESTSIDKDIARALTEAGLPLTSKNVEILEKYRDKVADILEPSDATISNMLRSKLANTINNLYTAKHSGLPKEAKIDITDEQITAVLDMNGIKVTQDNISAARSLISGNIEITQGNIKDFLNTQEILNDLDVDELVREAAKEMKKGQNPGDIEINHKQTNQSTGLGYGDIKQLVEDIQHIDEKVIEDTHSQNKPITMENLQQTLHENVEKILKGNQVDVENNEESAEDMDSGEVDPEKVATTKRQIEEIRLRLTVEAALKLNNKLDIQTSELHKVVEELKVIEKQANEEVLKNMGAPVTEENLEHMEKTNERIHNISQNKGLAAVQVVEGEADFTIEGMDEAIKAKHAQDIYEETGTKPERRFGESIAKVEEQLEHILDMQEIEATDTNIKAAKALVQNNIDITKESIEIAKIVLVKIETVLYELRPAVVAQMLQDGIRPDTMPIDSLIQHIREMQKDSVPTPTQKVAEGILELDKSNQLKVEEREGLIAVYRMLSTITKNETAAIGFLLDNNKEPTLGNLFEASKYIKQIGSKTGKMDVVVDDDLGIREGELPANIRSLIEGAINPPATGENMDKWINNKNILDQWLSRITPEELKKYIDMDKSLEELELKDGKLSSFEVGRTTKQVEALEKVSPQTLTFLKEQNIPLTIPSIYWADQMMKNPFLLGDMLNEYENLTGEKIETSISKNDNQQDIEEILDQLQKELDEQSPKWLSASQSTQAYTIGKELDQMLNLQKQVSSNEGMYQIPVELHHGMSNLNVYVMKDKEQSNKVEKDELRAYMSIKTKNIGVIQVHMRISDKAMAFEMIGETPQVTSGLKKNSNLLQAAIEDIGFNVMQAKFSQGEFKKFIIDKPQASTSLLNHRFAESKFEHII